MKLIVKKGRTSLLVHLFIQDSTSATGAGKTGLAYNTSSLVCYRARSDDGNAGGTSISLASATKGTWTSGGFVEKDATNMPGVYEFGVPDNALASGSENVVTMFKGAAGMAPCVLEIQLVAFDPQDSVRQGMTALPNAAAEASGGLPTLSAAQASNGTINVNVHRWLTGTPNALQAGRVDSYLGAVAAGVIAAASFAANALDAVWSTTTRLLTAGTNIALAKGTGVTGFNDLDTASVRSAVGMSSANLDTQLGAIAGYIDTEVGAIKAKTDNLPASPAAAGDIPTANENADALLDRAAGVETSLTIRQAMRLMAAALLGKASGLATTTAVFRDTNDSKDRITATVDPNGNRSAVTLDAS